MEAVFTLRDYNTLPEGFPAELLEGALVKEPAPTYGHQRFQGYVFMRLAELVGTNRAIPAPTDVVVDDHNVFQPDVVVLREPADDARSDVGIPWMAFEVLSPSSRDRDRGIKRRRLLEAGTAEVWLIDPDDGSIEVHTPTGFRRVIGDDEIRSEALDGFALVPSEVFAPAR